MTIARVTKETSEVLRGATSIPSRFTRLVVEVARTETIEIAARFTHIVTEVARTEPPVAFRAFPAVSFQRVNKTGFGDRVFPV